jgi:excisionase family DNA binding protein
MATQEADLEPADLTTEDVAATLGVSVATIGRKTRSGELPYVKIGHRTYRYRRSDVDAFIRGHLRYGDVAAVLERAGDP